MKKFLLSLLLTLFTFGGAIAQNALNNAADNIVGVYSSTYKGESFKVKIVKMSNGTYKGQVIWMSNPNDANGNKKLDTKNPDKSLRNTPCDQAVLFSGLKYNAKKKCWDGTKIYDPSRGLRANMMTEFEKDGRLRVRGSVMGIGESVYWNKEK